MTQRFKKILFFLIVLGFCISTPVLILYSQGYRYDFYNRNIVKTGGLFFKISPQASQIYINNKLSKKTNFIFGSAFLGGLIPKNYDIRIEKQGYHPWQKTVSVEQQKVTEYKHIQLFSKKPQFSLLTSSIDNFYIMPDQKEILTRKNEENGWTLEKLSLNTHSLNSFIKEQELINFLTLEEVEIRKGDSLKLQDKIEFSIDGKVLLNTRLDGKNFYFVIDTEKNIYLIDQKVEQLSFNPSNSDKLFFTAFQEEDNRQKLFVYNYKSEEEPIALKMPITEEKIKSYCLFDNAIYWLNEAGFLYKGNIDENRVELLEILNLKPIKISNEANYEITVKYESLIFLQEDEVLYYLDKDSHSLIKLVASLKEFKLSSDNKKISLRNDHEIIISFLEKEEVQPVRKAMERIRLIGVSEIIKNLFWLNDYYLIFSAGNSIQVVEIDDRDKPNNVEITTFENPTISWLEKQNTLLVLSNKKLFISKYILQ